jgi:uncharacterized protein (DUF2249 family)
VSHDQQPSGDRESTGRVDVRPLRKPDKHPTIFAAFRALEVGESFVLVNDHDPRHLHDEFEADYADAFDWEYLQRERGDWQIRITKLTTTALPVVLTNTAAPQDADIDASGALWRLEARDRDLDANLVAIPPDGSIDLHTGPDLDVLIHVVAGSGQLTVERGYRLLEPGALVWLPKRSKRQFVAGPEGLRYLTVHRRRTDALAISPVEPRQLS